MQHLVLKNEKAIVNSLLSPSVVPMCVMPARAHARRCVPACTSTVDDMNVHDSIIDARGCAALDSRAQDSIVDARDRVPADIRNASIVSAHDRAPVGNFHAPIFSARDCASVRTPTVHDRGVNASIGRGALPANNKVPVNNVFGRLQSPL
jgi:hypothetical protein